MQILIFRNLEILECPGILVAPGDVSAEAFGCAGDVGFNDGINRRFAVIRTMYVIVIVCSFGRCLNLPKRASTAKRKKARTLDSRARKKSPSGTDGSEKV